MLVDDYSTDGTREYLQNLHNDRVTLVLLPENGGVSHATNVGLSYATGKYCMFCDDDDYYLGGAVTSVVEASDDFDDVAFFGVKEKNETGECIFAPSFRNKDIKFAVQETIWNYYLYPQWGKLYKTAIIKDNQIEFKGCVNQDALFNLQYFSYCKSFSAYKNIVYVWHKHANSDSLSKKWAKSPFYYDEGVRSYSFFVKYIPKDILTIINDDYVIGQYNRLWALSRIEWKKLLPVLTQKIKHFRTHLYGLLSKDNRFRISPLFRIGARLKMDVPLAILMIIKSRIRNKRIRCSTK